MKLPDEILDAHQHFWLKGPAYPWLDNPADPERFVGDDTSIRRDYGPRDYLRDLDGLPIVGSVHVEANAADPIAEADRLEALRTKLGLPTVAVAGVDLSSADAPFVLDQLRERPMTRGVRQILNRHSDPHFAYTDIDYVRHPEWRRNLGRLAALGLSFDAQVFDFQLQDIAELAARYPDLVIVLNHAGMPLGTSGDDRERWLTGLRAVAARPNTVVKISGLAMVDHPLNAQRHAERVLATIQIFGPGRTMFASNAPVDTVYLSVRRLYEEYAQIVDGFSRDERRNLFADTARRVYRVDMERGGGRVGLRPPSS